MKTRSLRKCIRSVKDAAAAGGRSGALAGRAESRREDDEGGAIEHHPVAGEAAPLDSGILTFGIRARRRLKDEDKEIDECVGEKEIEQVAKPVGRSLGHCLPKILTFGAADTLLGHENSREKDNKDTCMKNSKKILGCDSTAEKSPDVYPDAEKKADESQERKETDQWLQPVWQGLLPRAGKARIGQRWPVAEKLFDSSFE